MMKIRESLSSQSADEDGEYEPRFNAIYFTSRIIDGTANVIKSLNKKKMFKDVV